MIIQCNKCRTRDKKIECLTKQINSIRTQLISREKELAGYRKRHTAIHKGVAGEIYIARLIRGAKLSPGGSPFDITLKSGKKVEVKFSDLNRPVAGSNVKRWDWHSIYGEKGTKRWNFLVLFGKKDQRFKEKYRDRSSPYVFFVLDRKDTRKVKQNANEAGHIALTTNPDRMHINNIKGRQLWQYKKSAQEIKKYFADK